MTSSSLRSRGRPPKGPQDRPFQMRVSEAFLRSLDDWRRQQADLPSRTEAVRRLVQAGLKSDTYVQPVGTVYQQIDGRSRNVTIMPAQLRMGRAAVRWGIRELAAKAGVSPNTVARIENGADAKQSTMDALQRALEVAGVEFTNGDRPGVRLIKLAERSATWKTAAPRPAKTSKKKG